MLAYVLYELVLLEEGASCQAPYFWVRVMVMKVLFPSCNVPHVEMRKERPTVEKTKV